MHENNYGLRDSKKMNTLVMALHAVRLQNKVSTN